MCRINGVGLSCHIGLCELIGLLADALHLNLILVCFVQQWLYFIHLDFDLILLPFPLIQLSPPYISIYIF